jgi:fermentation-respiration switch protein FrsA (DUF1100 family)
MKNSFVIFILLASAILTFAPAKFFPQSKNKLTGTWVGTLKASGTELRIVFNINESDSKVFTATMDSPDQGAKGIKVDSVIYSKNNIKFDVNMIHGYFEGRIVPDSLIIAGNWHQGEMIFPLELRKVDKAEDVKRPQEPKPPFPYIVKDVSFENTSANITLAGTLTIPDKGGPFPAVLLINGSGPQNRDEEIMKHKPFLVIADYLTRKGIAVLRVDDRGVGKSTGIFSGATTKDCASDALAGVVYLKSVKDVNPNEIGLIGHSEGGLIAPMVADETNDIAFIVLLAAPAMRGNQILLKQEALISKLSGIPDDVVKRDTSFKAELFNALIENKDKDKVETKIKKIVSNYYNSLSKKEREAAGSENNLFNEITRAYLIPWMEFFIKYNPLPALEKVKCPVLALDGSKDMQVPPKENLSAIKSALEKGGNTNFEIRELPELNHLFQDAITGSPLEYGRIEETFSPQALKIIGDWVLKIIREKNN